VDAVRGQPWYAPTRILFSSEAQNLTISVCKGFLTHLPRHSLSTPASIMARPLSDSINAPLRIPFRRFATQVIFSVVVTLVSNLLQIYGLLYAAIPFAILGVSVTHLALDRYTSSARSGSFPYCFILGCSLAYLHQLTTVIGQNFADGAPGFGRTQCGRALWLCVSRHLGARVLAQIPGHGQKCLVARAKSDEICRSTFVHGWPSTVHSRPRCLRLRRCRETIKLYCIDHG